MAEGISKDRISDVSSLLYWLKSEGYVVVGVDLDAETSETGKESAASLHIDLLRRNENAEEK